LGGVVRPRPGAGWRQNAIATGNALHRRISAQKDATRILLEVPDALERSDTYADLKGQMLAAGLQPTEAGDVALMVMTQVITARVPAESPVVERDGSVASIAVDSGSRGVILRAGLPDMQELIRVPPDQS